MPEDIVLTAEEHLYFPFFPPAFGGKVPPDHVQLSLEAKGMVRMHADGRRWVTLLGDKVRQGSVPCRIEV